MLLDDAYMPPVAAVVEHVRNSTAWRLEQPVSFRTAVVRKLADEVIDGEWKGHRHELRATCRRGSARGRRRPPARVQHKRRAEGGGARCARSRPFRRQRGLT